MDRIVILGGGVGGTLTANLLARKLRSRIDRGEVDITLVDALGAHVYQPGFMYIAMGGEREERLVRPERALLDAPVNLVVDRATAIDEVWRTVKLAGGTSLP
jgi:sulfide:quinone oxidoreductase